jgi:RecA/RadA recombinase
MFKKAERKGRFIKLAITGPTGSGKTYSALRLASGLTEAGKIALIDTENGSGSLYSDKFDYDVADIAPPFTPGKFIAAIQQAVDNHYECVIIDSASHFWKGILEMKDALDARGGNSFSNWGKVQADYERAINSFLHSRIHVIACMRSKMAYILEENDKGKQAPRRVGMQAIMRDDVEYEFTTVFDLAANHVALPTKDRTGIFVDQAFQITEETGRQITEWLSGNIEDPSRELMTQEQRDKVDSLLGKVRISKEKANSLASEIASGMSRSRADEIIDSLTALAKARAEKEKAKRQLDKKEATA